MKVTEIAEQTGLTIAETKTGIRAFVAERGIELPCAPRSGKTNIPDDVAQGYVAWKNNPPKRLNAGAAETTPEIAETITQQSIEPIAEMAAETGNDDGNEAEIPSVIAIADLAALLQRDAGSTIQAWNASGNLPSAVNQETLIPESAAIAFLEAFRELEESLVPKIKEGAIVLGSPHVGLEACEREGIAINRGIPTTTVEAIEEHLWGERFQLAVREGAIAQRRESLARKLGASHAKTQEAIAAVQEQAARLQGLTQSASQLEQAIDKMEAQRLAKLQEQKAEREKAEIPFLFQVLVDRDRKQLTAIPSDPNLIAVYSSYYATNQIETHPQWKKAQQLFSNYKSMGGEDFFSQGVASSTL